MINQSIKDIKQSPCHNDLAISLSQGNKCCSYLACFKLPILRLLKKKSRLYVDNYVWLLCISNLSLLVTHTLSSSWKQLRFSLTVSIFQIVILTLPSVYLAFGDTVCFSSPVDRWHPFKFCGKDTAICFAQIFTLHASQYKT